MNNQSQPPISNRSLFLRFFHWLFSWRGIRRILIVLAWTGTIIALLYGEENWRGRRAWNKHRQELEARGEQLDFRAFIPKPVPDEQNFAATPIIESWFQITDFEKRWKDNYSRASRKVSGPQKDKGNRHFLDFVAYSAKVWDAKTGIAFDAIRSGELKLMPPFESGKLDLESRAKAAPVILEALRDNEAMFAELRAARQRPYSRYPVIYDLENPWGILIPHLANIKLVCIRLELKACAELAAGQSENALEDVNLMLYLADSIKEEPFLMSYLVRVDCLQITAHAIWEGLAEHRWSDAQLQELQTGLQKYDFVSDLKRSLDAERAAGLLTVDLVRKKGHLAALLDLAKDTEFVDLIAKIIPSGWYYQEQLNYSRLYQIQLGGTFDAAKKRVSPAQIKSSAHELERELSGSAGAGKALKAIIIHHRIIAAMLLPALGNTVRKCAEAQTVVNQAALACALERFRLANGQSPEKLEALAPRFISQLPNDVLTGEPYKYHRRDDGQFVLYSIGWNEKDDSGVPGKTLYDEKQGDWVWQYPRK